MLKATNTKEERCESYLIDITMFNNMNLRNSRNKIIKILNWFKKSEVTYDTNMGESTITYATTK